MRNTNTQVKMFNAIRESKGRFFGLYTKQGDCFSAQFSSESPSYITLYDRKRRASRKIAKSSVVGVVISDKTIGSVY